MSQKAGQHLAVNSGVCWIRKMTVEEIGIQKLF